MGEIIGGNISNNNLDKFEHAYDVKWADINDIKNNKIFVRDTHIGLNQILVKAVKAALASGIWVNVLGEISALSQELKLEY